MDNTQKDMICVYSDTELNINRLRAELAKIGISSLVKNEFQSGVIAGFGAPVNAVDLYVNASESEEALAIIQDLNS
ncbi:hypothetical protein MATR_29480 [Marivirga tractuosa]|uniref:DUF2007 domain-containing protein n=1 Tax=Marivirga tractuosa (strain ATCC 23168 / DSM 4126 / NBRC 15989 / NCIMB 1408 / VKM B-1430 / H-43) TaxID=643867 RepID=E4TVY5_MARTH|nr:DUF2007 domain-containing protein [Marivirga tractuosa]ADR23203.1 hypothetical protein Ftrac_3229 [Marivirga tractuosa DSM 4126]BDD16123.1 hypothetical protein MATR_29480 [Marivirga tractuosa]